MQVAGVAAGSRVSTESGLIDRRRFPIGAEVAPGRGVSFRVWAPRSTSVAIESGSFIQGEEPELHPLRPEGNGYFSGFLSDFRPGLLYKFRLDSGSFPDPASRFQPMGPHGPSKIIDPADFAWTDHLWKGVSRSGQVIYEMHVGTFTLEGTWGAAVDRLEQLSDLGITIVEVMPVADFPGGFGWGYDGVNAFAPTRLYGRPDDMRAFVNRAHELGLGVILDVVYNHFGPGGNYICEFSKDYVTSRYRNEWGEAINFDGPNNGPVREYFLTNAQYWIREFHLDGLRLDATQQIFDSSHPHFLAELSRTARAAADSRSIYLVGENEPELCQLMRPLETGGMGLDALWNDDFHHSAHVALTGHNEAYYSDYQGAPQEFISAAKRGFLYQGQWYAWQKKPRGTPAFGIAPEQFVTFIQNHDQVANSLRGLRVHQLTSPGRLRAMTAVLLLGPNTPMLFQGQEFAASSPFLFFADHCEELNKLVVAGRKEFLGQFPSMASETASRCLAPPAARATFEACRLDWAERERNRETYALHQDLLKLRREDPIFSGISLVDIDGAVLGNAAFLLRFFGTNDDDRLLLVNLGRALRLSPVPEPMLAPPRLCSWQLLWASENPRYGGHGVPAFKVDDQFRLEAQCAVVLAPAATETEAR